MATLALGLGSRLEAQAPRAAKPASLTALAADPVAWRGVEAEFVMQFGSELESYHWWATRFNPSDYLGFSAWGDEQWLWEERAFNAPRTRLFVRRGTTAATVLAGTPLYRRFQVRAVVRTIFEGEPWIEILSATPLDRSLGQGSLLHATNAFVYLKDGQLDAARVQFDRAIAAPMPAAMRQALEVAQQGLAGNFETKR